MIYISTPPAALPPDKAKENVRNITGRLLSMGLLPISPLKFGFTPDWSDKQKQEYREKILRERATCIFLQNDWGKSNEAKREFYAVFEINKTRQRNNQIHIYFEDFGGFAELEGDIINGILIPHIV